MIMDAEESEAARSKAEKQLLTRVRRADEEEEDAC
jgi:hypothetical protein